MGRSVGAGWGAYARSSARGVLCLSRRRALTPAARVITRTHLDLAAASAFPSVSSPTAAATVAPHESQAVGASAHPSRTTRVPDRLHPPAISLPASRAVYVLAWVTAYHDGPSGDSVPPRSVPSARCGFVVAPSSISGAARGLRTTVPLSFARGRGAARSPASPATRRGRAPATRWTYSCICSAQRDAET